MSVPYLFCSGYRIHMSNSAKTEQEHILIVCIYADDLAIHVDISNTYMFV